jgi:NAD(P)H-quinone oxidoreductase subunit 5
MLAMPLTELVFLALALAPAALMAASAAWSAAAATRDEAAWQPFRALAAMALAFALLQPALLLGLAPPALSASAPGAPWIALGPLIAWMAVLVQLLGTVIGVFSSRYLQGEPGQRRYAAAFASVLAAVHLLLLADHWLVLIGAWAAVGFALQHLLCFYRDRPFALLAAHKKQIADRLADALLLGAAALAWTEVGSGSLSELRTHLAEHGTSAALQASAVCLVLAVILRTALLPVHGWLIQVMEAPTPVSAVLHAGVVNLGGFVLIRFAPLLEAAPAARWLLVVFGLATAVLAGLVMLTRVSVKVRLAWSTVAQMGFMILECGLGLYTLAALHLVGHSLYKAHAFLSSSSAVRETRLQMMRGPASTSPLALLLAPAASAAIVAAVQALLAPGAWPAWWSGVFALAWAPLLWLPAKAASGDAAAPWRGMAGFALVAGLSAVAAVAHALPLDLADAPFEAAGWVALAGMALLYLTLASLQWRPGRLATWRRWSYAGFYVDEFHTRLALVLWPTDWTRSGAPHPAHWTRPAAAEK